MQEFARNAPTEVGIIQKGHQLQAHQCIHILHSNALHVHTYVKFSFGALGAPELSEWPSNGMALSLRTEL